MTKEKNTLQPMPHMTIAEMASASGGTYRGDPSLLDKAVTGVYIDSRQVTPGCLFVPIKGARVDGHTFIPQVMEAGALCTLSEVDWAQTDQQDTACGEYSEELISAMRSIPYILVESTGKALQDLAAWYRINLDIPVIGITGSYGKTSAKEMAAAILGERFSVLKTAGNFNNRIGLPLTIFKIRPEHEAAVLEMGISDFGEMTVLAKIARPDIAMITTIGDCHLEFLIDRAGVYRAKSEMFDYMKDPAGPVILRADDEILGSVAEVNGHKPYFYGMQKENRYARESAAGSPGSGPDSGDLNYAWVSDISQRGLDGIDCVLHIGEKETPVHLPITGLHSLYHMMAGAVIADLLGMTMDEIAAGASRVQTVAGHGNIVRTEKYVILDDGYNANPASMEAALGTLSQTGRRRIAILGDMGELGENERALHRRVGTYAAACGLDLLICVGDLAREIMSGYQDAASEAECDEGRALCYDSRDALISELPSLLKDGDAVLVKASHFMGFEEIVKFMTEL